MYDIRETILEERPIITKDELNRLILDAVENKGIIEGPIKKDLIKMLLDTDEKLKESRERFSDELSNITHSSDEVLLSETKEKPKRVIKKTVKKTANRKRTKA